MSSGSIILTQLGDYSFQEMEQHAAANQIYSDDCRIVLEKAKAEADREGVPYQKIMFYYDNVTASLAYHFRGLGVTAERHRLVFKQLNAYRVYLNHGIEQVERLYRDQVPFIESVKDGAPVEVMAELQAKLDKKYYE